MEAMQHLFKHMGEKSGRDLNLDVVSQERKSVDYSDPKEAEFRFGQRSGFKPKRRDFDRYDRDFRNKDKREFRFKDRRQGRRESEFEERNGLKNFMFEEQTDWDLEDDFDSERRSFKERRDSRFQGRRDFRNDKPRNFRNNFYGDETDFEYNEDNDFKPRRKNPVFQNDE